MAARVQSLAAMRAAQVRRRQGYRAKPASHPAPIGGWNARDSLAAMDEKDAVTLDNWWPNPSDVQARLGYTQWSTALPSYAETLMVYGGPTAQKMFAISSARIYDVSSGGAVSSNWLNLPAVGADFISTPDAAANELLGNIAIVVYIAPTSWANGNIQTVYSKYGAVGNRAWRLTIDAAGGFFSLRHSADGTTLLSNSSGALPFVAGQGAWLLAALQASDGAGNRVYNFWYSTDPATTAPSAVNWTQSVFNGVAAGNTTLFNSTANVEVGFNAGASGAPLAGTCYRAQIYTFTGAFASLSASTLKQDFNPSDGAVGAATLTSSTTGEVYTISGAATIAGAQVVIGLTNSRFEYQNVSTAGGAFMLAVNGFDKLRGYNGTTWWTDGDGTHDITGVDTSTCLNISLFKNRVWLIEKNSLRAWYLPTSSIAGAASSLDFSSIAQHGGQLLAMGTWTLDAGYGADDMAVFITSMGEVIVYRGTDPAFGATWGLAGVWNVGSAFNTRCLLKWGGDLLTLTYDGLFPLAQYLQSSRLDPRVALTDKIYSAISAATTAYGSRFGWDMEYFAKANMLILNIPVDETGDQIQYAMNTITKSWCSFSGMGASCWAVFNDNLYFGGNSYVAQAWNGFSDYSTSTASNINTNALTAFSDFGNAGTLKRWMMIRPIFLTNGSPSTLGGMNVDFDLSDNTGSLSFSPTTYATWDTAVWDTSTWGGGLGISKNWQGSGGVGTWGAVRVKTATQGIETHWVSTTYVMEPGAII